MQPKGLRVWLKQKEGLANMGKDLHSILSTTKPPVSFTYLFVTYQLCPIELSAIREVSKSMLSKTVRLVPCYGSVLSSRNRLRSRKDACPSGNFISEVQPCEQAERRYTLGGSTPKKLLIQPWPIKESFKYQKDNSRKKKTVAVNLSNICVFHLTLHHQLFQGVHS
jgi:hypothetical protein